MRVFRILTSSVCSLFLSGVWYAVPVAAAYEVTSFYTGDQNPFIQIFGLPYLESEPLLASGGRRMKLVLDITNNAIRGDNAQESIELDGESYRTTLVYRYGLGSGREIGFDLPYVAHDGGVFDHFIDSWHNTFGLAGRWREEQNFDQMRYSYQRDGVQRYHLTSDQRGIGDLRLVGAQRLYEEGQAQRHLNLRATLKLPTGDADGLQGSGAPDLAFSLSGSDRKSLAMLRCTVFGAAGVLFLGQGDVLEELQEDVVWFGSLGLGWQALSWLDLKLQLDMHSAFYNSHLAALGNDAVQLMTGGSMRFNGDLYVDIGVSENLTTDPTPDVGLNLALRKTF